MPFMVRRLISPESRLSHPNRPIILHLKQDHPSMCSNRPVCYPNWCCDLQFRFQNGVAWYWGWSTLRRSIAPGRATLHCKWFFGRFPGFIHVLWYNAPFCSKRLWLITLHFYTRQLHRRRAPIGWIDTGAFLFHNSVSIHSFGES